MTVPPDAVLFDFFGTLADYHPDRVRQQYPQTHALAAQLGFSGSHDVFSSTWDRATSELETAQQAHHEEFSMTDAATAFGAAAGVELTAEDAIRLGRSYVAEWQAHVRPVSMLAEVVATLRSRARLAVVSNTHDPDMVPRLLADFGVAHHFDVVILSVVHGRRKPDASIYRAALDALGCPADRACFVGDSHEADWQGPSELGIRALLIDPAHQYPIPAADRIVALSEVISRLAL